MPLKYLNADWEVKNVIAVSALVVCSLFTTAMDFMESYWQVKEFYFSESFLFSCYWWLFLPLVLIQRRSLKGWGSGWQGFVISCGLAVVHLLLYPVLVMVLSYLFLEHTFAYQQTLQYAMTSYPLITFLVYLALNLLGLMESFIDKKQDIGEVSVEGEAVLSSILVKERDGSKTVLRVEDILYLRADSPYIAIYSQDKKYLHDVSLREMEQRLSPSNFVRIHRSAIINRAHVLGIKSRQNGDYDLTLSNHSVLRLSRRYAAHFKLLLPG